MLNPERLIRSIIGDTGSSIYPLACAAEIVGREFFDSHTPLEDVKPGQVYTQVSKEMGISFDAASKRIQRMANFCWECMLKRELVEQYIGRTLADSPSACRLAGYLAFYACCDTPYYVALEKDPRILFNSDANPAIFLKKENFLKDPVPDWTLIPACSDCRCYLEQLRPSYCCYCGARLDKHEQSSVPQISLETGEKPWKKIRKKKD
ncbi:MAG: hypothetical protein HFF83_12345 [Oscillibacter sp.]|jgi:hypothetical protein|nr:hypothetical protein [Oscillibacter sp.]